MGSESSPRRHRARAPWRRPVEVVVPTFAVFLLLAVTADVILAMREPRGHLGRAPAGPAADGHRRVLLLGDSLLDGAVPELTGIFDRHGVASRFEGAPGTGPLTPPGWWREELRVAVEEFNPDVVVIEACCNYDSEAPHRVYGGKVVEADSPEMYKQWEMAMLELVALAGARGAHVFVVAIPPPAAPGVFASLAPRVDRLNRIYTGLRVPLIDWAAALPPTERASDGLHLSDRADQLVTEATWAAVAGHFP